MLFELLKTLDIDPEGIYFDCTFGGGGHSIEILRYLNSNGVLNALDKDSFHFKKSKFDFLKKSNFFFHKSSFEDITDIAIKLNIFGKVNGIIADFGISTDHFFEYDRGFSFVNNGFLDMRLDVEQKIRAIDWLNFAKFEELFSVFYFFDDFKLIKNVIKEILRARSSGGIKTVNDFYEIILRVCGDNNISNKCFNKFFHFIRVLINNDYFLIHKFLINAFSSLKKSGILVLISFNSIEDKVVKDFFFNSNLCIKSAVKFIKPSLDELNFNHSARSAIMRVFIKS